MDAPVQEDDIPTPAVRGLDRAPAPLRRTDRSTLGANHLLSLGLALGILTLACVFASHDGDTVSFVEPSSAFSASTPAGSAA